MKDTLDQFVKKVTAEFEDEQAVDIDPDAVLRQTEFWTSMHALITLAFINTEYGVSLTGEELRKALTFRDIYELVVQKI